MTDAELDGWLAMLGDTRVKQGATIRDLLRHANGDRMTVEDRAICIRALRRLGDSYVAPPPVRYTRSEIERSDRARENMRRLRAERRAKRKCLTCGAELHDAHTTCHGCRSAGRTEYALRCFAVASSSSTTASSP